MSWPNPGFSPLIRTKTLTNNQLLLLVNVNWLNEAICKSALWKVVRYLLLCEISF